MSAQVDNIIKIIRPKMDSVIKNFEAELSGLRAGRAQASMIENVMVDVYGSAMPLKALAYISVPDAMSLLVAPFDKGTLKPIEDALSKADLGAMPVNTGIAIRINFPPLTEERRLEISKVAKAKAEESRISVRMVRKEGWDSVQKLEGASQISEDDRYYGEEHLNRLAEEYNKKIEEILFKKEEELRKI